MRISLISLVFASTATALFAGERQPLPLTYDAFEVSVEHLDLDTCPEALATESVFCRATLASDQIHVFVFSEEGESPLVGFASYDADNLSSLLN